MILNKTSIKKEEKNINPQSTKGGSNFNPITLKYKPNKSSKAKKNKRSKELSAIYKALDSMITNQTAIITSINGILNNKQRKQFDFILIVIAKIRRKAKIDSCSKIQ